MSNLNLAAWGAEIRSYNMPHDPVAIWYVSEQNANLALASEIGNILENPKIMANVAWIDRGSILVIIWATSSLEGMTEAIEGVAIRCNIPTSRLAN